jgi:hypothetical protein
MTMPTYYEITIQGHLDQHWSTWFDGLSITHEPDGTTTLAGLIVDQAALHGVLIKVRDLGLPLIGVCPVARDSSNNAHAERDRTSCS